MTAKRHNPTASRWARAGVLFNVTPARRSPDLQRLLLDTARQCEHNARLFIAAVTWLVGFGTYIARHRLKHLAVTELEQQYRPVLGLIVDTAIDAGATGELRAVLEVCPPAAEPRPLFAVDRKTPGFAGTFQRTATEASRRWNLWVQAIELKPDALRPAAWVLEKNPAYRDRALRRGDLRCSILEVLRLDAPAGRLPSESELTRRCAANRTAVRRALDKLAREGHDLRARPASNHRDQPIRLEG